MVKTGIGAIGQQRRAWNLFHRNRWNGNMNRGNLQGHFDAAQAQFLAVLQRGFLDGLPVNEGAIGGTQITDKDTRVGSMDFAMITGNRSINDLKVVQRISPQAAHSWFQFNDLFLGPSNVEEKSAHTNFAAPLR